MNKKLIYALVAIAFVFFVTSLIIFLKSKSPGEPKSEPTQKIVTQSETDQPPLLKVKIFYYTEKSRYMRPVSHELENSQIRIELYKRFIDLIIQEKEDFITPVPQGLRLRSLYYIESKMLLVLDFNDTLITRFPAGSTSELEFIYFIVDNICFNFEEVKMVKFLVSGNEYNTISGHIDIENPFYPDYRYLKIK